MSFLARYKQFLTELEEIADEHDELTDTDVRERLYTVINYYFVWENPIAEDFPKRYALFSSRGDNKVHHAVKNFITEALLLAQQEGIASGETRHQALENEEAMTERGACYDEFLGSSESVLPPEKPAADSSYDYYSE